MDQLVSDQWLQQAVELLIRLIDSAGALVIFAGAVIGFIRFCRSALRPQRAGEFTSIRLGLGRFLALGLEFQLASDLLQTAVAPSFEQIGRLAAIAAIRTALNFFLAREIQEERQALQERPPATAAVAEPP